MTVVVMVIYIFCDRYVHDHFCIHDHDHDDECMIMIIVIIM